MTMPPIPDLGIRFSIDKLETLQVDQTGLTIGGYGFIAYFLFWKCVDPGWLAGTTFHSGDTAATLGGRENCCCIGIGGISAPAKQRVKECLSAFDEFNRVAGEIPFLEHADMSREPLVIDAAIDANGRILPPPGKTEIGQQLVEGLWKARSVDLRMRRDAGGATAEPQTDLCDLCNSEVLSSQSTMLSLREIHKLVRNGFAPCIGGIGFQNGRDMTALASALGFTSADADIAWKTFVLADHSPWVLCSKCNGATARFQSGPVPDTRRPIMDWSMSPKKEFPSGWKPGFGKTVVILMGVAQKPAVSAIRSFICDICGLELPQSELRMAGAPIVQRAIHSGLNAWADPDINSSRLRANLEQHGVTPDAAYRQWREKSLADPTDWRLCPPCNTAVERWAQPRSTPPPSPGGKKWWKPWS